jgi:hypothetical protein
MSRPRTTYVIEVNERTQDLCEFLNDGVRPGLQTPPSWLLCIIDGPREITTSLKHPNERLNPDGVMEQEYIFLK